MKEKMQWEPPAWTERCSDEQLAEVAEQAIVTLREQIETLEAFVRRINGRKKD